MHPTLTDELYSPFLDRFLHVRGVSLEATMLDPGAVQTLVIISINKAQPLDWITRGRSKENLELKRAVKGLRALTRGIVKSTVTNTE